MKKSYKVTNPDLTDFKLLEEIDQVWNELQVDSPVRRLAIKKGINLDEIIKIKRQDAIDIEIKGSGLDAAGTALIVSFAPVAAKIVMDLWNHVILRIIINKWGADALEENTDD